MSNTIAMSGGIAPTLPKGASAMQSTSGPADQGAVGHDAVAAPASVPGGSKTGGVDLRQLEKEVMRANSAMEAQRQDIAFSIDRDANSLVIKIINRSDQQVVKQIPSEQMLDFMHRVNAALESHSSAGLLLQGEA